MPRKLSETFGYFHGVLKTHLPFLRARGISDIWSVWILRRGRDFLSTSEVGMELKPSSFYSIQVYSYQMLADGTGLITSFNKSNFSGVYISKCVNIILFTLLTAFQG